MSDISSFELTADQDKIVTYIREQLKSKQNNVIISAAAGCGKTTMICWLIADLVQEGYTVAAAAFTGKASGVLREKIHKAFKDKGIEIPSDKKLLIDTVSRITKKSKVIGISREGETQYLNEWRSPKTFQYDILVLDEASMLPHEIGVWASMGDFLTVYLGDFCQIREVKTEDNRQDLVRFKHDLKISNTNFVSGYGIRILERQAQCQLTEVLRSTGDITRLCNDLRDFTLSKKEVIRVIKDWAGKSEDIEYSTNYEDIDTEPNTQIIAYTNKMCAAINQELMIGDGYPSLLDKLIIHDNLSPVNIFNGTVILFKDFLHTIQEYNEAAKQKLFVVLKYQNRMPRKDSPSELERNFFQIYTQFKQAFASTARRRMNNLERVLRSSFLSTTEVEQYLRDIEIIKKDEPDLEKCFIKLIDRLEAIDIDIARFVVDNSEQLPRLHMISCDLGYCITTHRAQASEYSKVCVIIEKWDRPLVYTACSRAKEKLKIIDLTKG